MKLLTWRIMTVLMTHIFPRSIYCMFELLPFLLKCSLACDQEGVPEIAPVLTDPPPNITSTARAWARPSLLWQRCLCQTSNPSHILGSICYFWSIICFIKFFSSSRAIRWQCVELGNERGDNSIKHWFWCTRKSSIPGRRWWFDGTFVAVHWKKRSVIVRVEI